MKWSVFWIVAVTALSGLLFGYNTAIISTASLFLIKKFHLKTFQEEIVVSIILIGALIGALGGGTIADRIGRKWTIILTAIVYLISGLFLALAVDLPMIMLGRFIGGLALGVSSMAAPLYIAEISPPKYRGALVTSFQLAITIGILVAYLIGYAFAETRDWRWMFGVSIIPAIVQWVGMLFAPESPRWLLIKNKTEKALSILKKLRSGNVGRELEEMQKIESKTKEGGWKSLFNKAFLAPLILGIGLSVFQQITGINTVFYYAPQIFEITGFATPSKAILASIAIGTINVIATIISLWLIDKIGRRKLLLIGIAGMAISLLFLSMGFITHEKGLYDLSLFSLMAYVTFFAIGLGPCVWLIVSEIYPLHIRAKAMSIAIGFNWICNFIVSLTFLTLVHNLGSGETFLLYALICVLAWWFVFKLLPETKGKTLGEIESFWKKKK